MLKLRLQTNATLTTFLFSMALNPDVFKNVQAEKDQVTGGERLLGFDDKESLPYLSCVVKEVLLYVLITPIRH
jgi:cytochrome P450